MTVSDSAIERPIVGGWRAIRSRLARLRPFRAAPSAVCLPQAPRDVRWKCAPPPSLKLDAPLAPPAKAAAALPANLLQAPPWLISLAAHLAMMVTLALGTVAVEPDRGPHFITLGSVDASAMPALDELPAMKMSVAHSEAIPATSATIAALEPVDPEVPAISLDLLAAGGNRPSAAAGELSELLASGGSGQNSDEVGGPSAEFFGVQARGHRFVFVVDSSNSMHYGKLEAAKKELLYAIRRLSSDQFFYVIFFSGQTLPMSLDGSGEPTKELVPATNENILRLEEWVATVDVSPWTDPHESIKRALAMQPDAIYLLSDGRFTDNGETLRLLKRENVDRSGKLRKPKVKIHTVGFHQRDGETTLKSIARNYGGQYRFIPASR